MLGRGEGGGVEGRCCRGAHDDDAFLLTGSLAARGLRPWVPAKDTLCPWALSPRGLPTCEDGIANVRSWPAPEDAWGGHPTKNVRARVPGADAVPGGEQMRPEPRRPWIFWQEKQKLDTRNGSPSLGEMVETGGR